MNNRNLSRYQTCVSIRCRRMFPSHCRHRRCVAEKMVTMTKTKKAMITVLQNIIYGNNIITIDIVGIYDVVNSSPSSTSPVESGPSQSTHHAIANHVQRVRSHEAKQPFIQGLCNINKFNIRPSSPTTVHFITTTLATSIINDDDNDDDDDDGERNGNKCGKVEVKNNYIEILAYPCALTMYRRIHNLTSTPVRVYPNLTNGTDEQDYYNNKDTVYYAA